jgi:uncharacterized membrane protein
MKRVGVVLILFLAFFGLADSAYLAQNALSGTPLICDIQSLSGCNTVAASEYSRIFGIPLAEFGVLLYSIIFVLAALELVLFDRFLRRVLQVVSGIGAAVSLYYAFIQVFVIGAFCIYCFASSVTAILIFIFATLIEPMRRRPQSCQIESSVSPHFPLPPKT